MFGTTFTYLRCLVFQISELIHFSSRFSKDKETAGKKSYYELMRRHPQPSLKAATSTSLARAQGFNRERVKKFSDFIERTVEDNNNLDTSRIYDVHETGLTTVQKKSRRVVSMKVRSKICSVSSGERGVNTITVCCVSDAACYVPPMLIYKRARRCNDFKDGVPPGTGFTFNLESSYINKKGLFLK